MLETLFVKHKQNPIDALKALQQTIVQWNVNSQTRHALLELDDWQLDDIGIDRKTANEEGKKMFWQQ